ncbi:hypothetical protein HETIRDRAFT_440257 [Heterobasidion irregulare TC 32-1]|uniref:Uncharacterized protein n=1 Tax=Heterobasidion irregulare (strain TC 32-1) TaxID=747525 RepID=W4KBA5_HETIT|nr:uncharacterized protein HETIRDRAFT_440257 [Heterobasidion irregulare TC 32-1]ETW82326.1 hypothetical protein HETIRDRAFT_440257 [Heterobasidion irregulare TC 32-1]
MTRVENAGGAKRQRQWPWQVNVSCCGGQTRNDSSAHARDLLLFTGPRLLRLRSDMVNPFILERSPSIVMFPQTKLHSRERRPCWPASCP